MVAKIEQEKIPRLQGLFSRIVIASLSIASLTIIVMALLFSAYLDVMATTQAKKRLETSIAILSPVIDGAVLRGENAAARQVLVNLVAEKGVVCVDYQGPTLEGAIQDAPALVISLPQGGCASFTDHDTSYLPVATKSSSSGFYRFYIDPRYFTDDRNQQLVTMISAVMLVVLAIFTLLAFVFRWLVLSPLKNLQNAMLSSQPSKPALADIFRGDEIGAVSKTYNKLAAASRIYFGLLQKSQDKLKESEGKFRDMAEISGDWFYEMDREFRLQYISDRFFEITKGSPDQVIGKTRAEIVGEKAETAFWQSHMALLASHQPFRNFEYPFLSESGETFMLRISGKPIFDDDGHFIGYRGTGSDVTQLTKDKKLLEDTNRNFGESVSYASAIQRGLLPEPDRLSAMIGKSSLLWQPKDLVGGDFYWIGQIGSARYLVFFDCTGHGVPGAFMTLITVSVLETIKAASPFAIPAAQMLEQIHRGVCAKLAITQDKAGKDGLDCAVVRIDSSEGQLEFAGASMDIYCINEDGAVERIRGARHTLGYQIYAEARDFPSHHRPLAGNSFLLMSDGLATQIGEETKRVLGTRRIIEALEGGKTNAPAKLVRTLGLLLKRWQLSEERRDDVTILAFRPQD